MGLSFCLSRTFCNILLLIQTKLEPKLIMIVHQEEDKVCFSIVHLFPLKNRNKQVKIFLFFIRSVSDVFDTKHEVPFSNLFFLLMITQKALHCLMRVKPQALVWHKKKVNFKNVFEWFMNFFMKLGKRPRQTIILSETDILISSTLNQFFSSL